MTSIVAGPSGGIGGTPFTDDIPSNSTVGQLQIRAAAMIDSVQFLHVGLGGGVIASPAHGGLGGELHTIPLGDDRYVASIKGRYGEFVDSLTIKTAPITPVGLSEKEIIALHLAAKVPTFGGKGGSSRFVYHAPPGYEIAGFCGRSANLVDAIGVVFRPLAERGLNTDTQAVALTPGVLTGGTGNQPPSGQTPEEPPPDGPMERSGRPISPPTEEPPPEEPMERSGGPIKPR